MVRALLALFVLIFRREPMSAGPGGVQPDMIGT